MIGYKVILPIINSPLMIYFFISFIWDGIFAYEFSLVNKWSLLGVYGLNLIGTFFEDIFLYILAVAYAGIMKID